MKQSVIDLCTTYIDRYIKQRTGMILSRKLKRFFHTAEKSPQECLCQVHTKTYLFWTSLTKKITFCSLKHYSNISTFLSCFLIKKVVFWEFFTSQCDEIRSVCQRSAYPRVFGFSFRSPVDAMVSKSRAEKLGHLVTLLTSFTAKCKKHNRERAAGQMDTLQLKTFLKEKDPGSFHLLTARVCCQYQPDTYFTVVNCYPQYISKSYLLNFLDLKYNFQFQIRFSLGKLVVKTFFANLKRTLLLAAEFFKK